MDTREVFRYHLRHGLIGAVIACTVVPWGACNTCRTSNSTDLPFSLHKTSTWMEFPLTYTPLKNQHKKWVWKESLTFKSKQAVQLKSLCLKWNGAPIASLQASLYKKGKTENLLPVQKNLVSDGVWNPQTQELYFDVNEKLIALNTYHVVLSFPQNIESVVKRGSFTLVKNKSFQLVALS